MDPLPRLACTAPALPVPSLPSLPRSIPALGSSPRFEPLRHRFAGGGGPIHPNPNPNPRSHPPLALALTLTLTLTLTLALALTLTLTLCRRPLCPLLTIACSLRSCSLPLSSSSWVR